LRGREKFHWARSKRGENVCAMEAARNIPAREAFVYQARALVTNVPRAQCRG